MTTYKYKGIDRNYSYFNTSPYQVTAKLITPLYAKRWFEASSFFNTVLTSQIIDKFYFITYDEFMSNKENLTYKVYALRFINKDKQQIQTLLESENKGAFLTKVKLLLTGAIEWI